jgi:hypothetical protein
MTDPQVDVGRSLRLDLRSKRKDHGAEGGVQLHSNLAP